MTIAWVDANTGALLRLTSDDGNGPRNSVPVGEPPESGRQIWDFTTKTWSAPPPPTVTPITARELADVLKTKGVIVEADLPRRGPPI